MLTEVKWTKHSQTSDSRPDRLQGVVLQLPVSEWLVGQLPILESVLQTFFWKESCCPHLERKAYASSLIIPQIFRKLCQWGGAKSKRLPYSVTQVFHQNEILYINLFFQPKRCCEGHSIKQESFGMFLFPSICHFVHLSALSPCPALSKPLKTILIWCIPMIQSRMLNRWITLQVIGGDVRGGVGTGTQKRKSLFIDLLPLSF